MKKLLYILFLLPFFATAQQVVTIPVKVPGGGNGTSDGNNLLANVITNGATLSFIRQGLPNLIVLQDTGFTGMATVQGTLYRLDSLKAAIGASNSLTGQAFSGLTFTSVINGTTEITSTVDTSTGGVTARDDIDNNFPYRKGPFEENGYNTGFIQYNRLGQPIDTTRVYNISGGTPPPTGTGHYPFIRNNVANRFLFTNGRTDTLEASSVLTYNPLNTRIGIGTTAPITKLDVAGTLALTGNITHRSTGNLSTNGFAYTSFQDNLSGSFIERGWIGYGTGDKNIGITTFVPNSAITFRSSNTTEMMRVNTDGNVGIGTATPAYKLDVAGTARISGTVNLSGLTASQGLALDVNKNIVSTPLQITGYNDVTKATATIAGSATGLIASFTPPDNTSGICEVEFFGGENATRLDGKKYVRWDKISGVLTIRRTVVLIATDAGASATASDFSIQSNGARLEANLTANTNTAAESYTAVIRTTYQTN